MAIYYRHLDEHIVVSGKTYPYRDIIKSYGGRFENSQRVWHIPHNEASLKAIDELCRSVGGGPLKDPAATKASRKKSPTVESIPVKAPVATSENAETADHQLGLTVRDLMQQTQLAIQAAFPRSVWVIGEIQNFSMRKTGVFFQLADFKEGASQSATMTVSTTMWSSQARALAQKLGKDVMMGILQDGMKVRILAQVGFYRDRGQVTLNVLDIDPRYTKGSLALAREELLRELRQKGLDRLNATRPLTAFPLKIGLVSAEDSRAKSDFIHQLFSYGFPGEVIFYAAQMQGERTLTEVCQGIQSLAAAGCDLIVLTRGGGSLADLRWFDNKDIAMAIIQCQLPVIAAIGHQDDVCVAEEVAFRREKTPTAAADFILSIVQKTKDRLSTAAQAMTRTLEQKLQQQQTRLQHLKEQLGMICQQQLNQLSEKLNRHIYLLQQSLVQQEHKLSQQLQAKTHEIKRLSEQRLYALQEQNLRFGHQLRQNYQFALGQAAMSLQKTEQQLFSTSQQNLFRIEHLLAPLEKTLHQNDPRPWLQRGWTRLESLAGQTIRSVHALSVGQELQARLQDGNLKLNITEIEAIQANKDQS
ncbi:MAG: exodeoxyribonuclease VII large subunit [Oligoflexus sp.]